VPISEERKIYRVGKSSLAITLPRNWLKYFGLIAGDTVEITGDGDLTIHPLKKQKLLSPIDAATPNVPDPEKGSSGGP
jgi:antitoxin component of MazEF toxin-antitoxin module